MKLKILVKYFVVLLLLGCSESNKIAQISFDKDVIDLGEIDGDKDYKVTFSYKNAGTNVLKIKSVTSDCHCTVARNFENNILPNTSGEINVSYHSKNFGYFEQLIEVNSNSEKPSVLLIIKGRVKQPIPK